MAYGEAPYAEAAAKGQARISMMHRLGQIFAGAGAGVHAAQGAGNPFEAGALGFAGGFGQANAARQAAEAYAMKKIEAENQRRHQALQEQLTQAQITKLGKEPPPKVVPIDPLLEEKRALLKAQAAAAHARANAHGNPKVAKPRAAVMNRIDLINQADPNNPEHRARLQSIVANPATPEEKDAALKRLEIAPGYYRR